MEKQLRENCGKQLIDQRLSCKVHENRVTEYNLAVFQFLGYICMPTY